ncbi:MAG: hypothetical protein QOI98_1566 [Solirubrobacteraceae bacterium]|nr:hypothetical protein [Solirubrobacteraceae bacterium]
MEEARQRAQRRRRSYGAGILITALVGLGAFFAFRGGDGPDSAQESARDRVVAALRWRPLPPAPIAGRTGEGVVWTGAEMIVWGGLHEGRHGLGPTAVSNGAAYNPATRTWRKLAAAPRGMRGVVGSGSVWTGEAALFWTGNSPDGPRGGALYYPRTDKWRRLPVGPLGPREGYSTFWTGQEALIVSGTRGDAFASPIAAAINPKTLRWRQLSPINRLTGLLADGVWSGREAYLLGARYRCPELGSSCRDRRRIFLAYNPATDRVRRISLAKAPTSDLASVAWAHGQMLVSSDDESYTLDRYDPRTRLWSTGASAPCEPASKGYHQSEWIGDRYVAACGHKSLQLYDPRSDTWRKIHPGPSPFNSRAGSAIVWTGKELIAWSGSLYKAGNPMAASGASLKLPD